MLLNKPISKKPIYFSSLKKFKYAFDLTKLEQRIFLILILFSLKIFLILLKLSFGRHKNLNSKIICDLFII